MNRYLSGLLFLSMNACASTPDCGSLDTQLEMNTCMAAKFTHADQQLAQKVEALSVLLEGEKHLLDANTAWQRYRDSHCLSVASIYEGGSLYNSVLLSCKLDQTRIRAQSLDNDYRETVNIITKGTP